jgi:hypothetical protein
MGVRRAIVEATERLPTGSITGAAPIGTTAERCASPAKLVTRSPTAFASSTNRTTRGADYERQPGRSGAVVLLDRSACNGRGTARHEVGR